MTGLNFTLQDILGAAAAFFIFPIVILFPAYVLGWGLDLFDFRRRQPLVKWGIGLVLSISITPILLDLTSRLVSIKFSILILAGVTALFVLIFLRDKRAHVTESRQHVAPILWGIGGWFVFVIFSLVNIQWKDQLFLSAVADQITRVSVINAITRTGVPAANPGYYPGHAVPLTGLFYFWYLLCSVVDVLGGRIVDARAALTASSIWSGIGLAAMLGLYLRQRNPVSAAAAWSSFKTGLALLLVGGLDAVLFFFFAPGLANITGGTGNLSTLQSLLIAWRNLEYFVLTLLGTWVGSLLWVPHHIAGVIAALTALLLAHSARRRKSSSQFVILGIAGLALASAVGLSTWVTLAFSIFWGAWILALVIQKADRSLVLSMMSSGLIALLAASPFLMAAMGDRSAGGSHTSLVFSLQILPFLAPLIKDLPVALQWIVGLLMLPLGYLLELGFFFVACIYWLKRQDKKKISSHPFHLQEVLLLAVVFGTATFFRTFYGTMEIKDLAWRGWLLGQFILLVWAVDILREFRFRKSDRVPAPVNAAYARLMYALIAIGILTTLMVTIFSRISEPVLAGAEGSRRTYSARQAYDYLRDHVPGNVITQYNPTRSYDAPAGLYGTHQLLISDLTAYGTPAEVSTRLENDMSAIFSLEDASHWRLIDRICRRRSVGVLIISDTDPLWDSLSVLKLARPPLYENSHFALYACGDYSGN